MSSIVVVGLDGSRESRAAAAWAAREAVLRDAPLRLVHAWQPQPSAPAAFAGVSQSALYSDLQGWSDRLLHEAQAELSRRHPGLDVTCELHPEQAVPVLLAAAEDAGLLVLGSRGLGGVAGFLLGSVALTVVARSRRPVVLVRGDERPEDEHLPDASGAASSTTPYRDVVLGLNLEQPHDAVTGFAFDAAARRAAGLRVVYGWNPPALTDHGAFTDVVQAELTGSMRGALHEVLAPWREKFPGVEVTAQAVVGKAGSHLVGASRDASLVVVGRAASQTPFGARVGPVTHAVLHHAAAPVAVVPHA
ncbi:universal stress protein [Streptomyces sp. TRM68416]|uniref:universal stress protein n=1 Tax=Streptomyces sp. TRM68416 TaxID=2758412 RepID=UPI001661A448|nr:universal stress protein [Streptomyces sp. TRM68416]MBD0843011.1 universal stress protein [Streptomyces sp. TRM68416]